MVPQNDVIERRLENWRIKWESKIIEQINAAGRMDILELGRARTEVKLVERLAKETKKHVGEGEELHTMLRLVESLGNITHPSRRWHNGRY